LALGIPAAWLSSAGVCTFTVDTGSLAGTLAVRPAANLDPGAACSLRTFESWGAGAVHFMSNHCAFGWPHTGVLDGTRADAVVVVAGLV